MTAYRFARYTLDLTRGCLRDGDREVKLRRKSFDLLVFFAANAGRLLSKDELMAAVWPGQIVSDDSLVQCVREIRRALVGDARASIKTVAGRGYIFDLPVAQVELEPPRHATHAAHRADWSHMAWHALRDHFGALSPMRKAIAAALVAALGVALVWPLADSPTPSPSAAVPAPALTAQTPRQSIVVLPFANLSGDLGQDYLADAIAGDITAELSRLREAIVISRGSALTYKDKPLDLKAVGRELGVRYVVLGSMRRDGEEVHLNVQLIEAETGIQRWADRIDYKHADRFEVQNRIVVHVARTLRVELIAAESQRSLRERPDNPDAVDLAMRARALTDNRQIVEVNEQARRLYEAALALDRNLVMALVGIAAVDISHVVNQWPPQGDRGERLSRAEHVLAQALALTPNNPGAQRQRGRVLRARGDAEQAVVAFERALELNPNMAEAQAELGRTKIDIGLASETAGHIERAVRLSPRDPLVGIWYFWAGQAAVHVGDGEAAVKWLRKALEALPGYDNPVPWLAVANALLGHDDEGRAYMDEFRRRHPERRISGWDGAYQRRHPVVLTQRERIAEALRKLGVPE